MDREEGEMSDDNAMLVDGIQSPVKDNSNCTLVSKIKTLALLSLFWYIFVI